MPLSNPREYTANEIKFARDIITYWTNFAKNGSPNPSNSLETWPEYKYPDWTYMNLTVGTFGLTGSENLATQCSFFNDVLPEFIPKKMDDNDGINLRNLNRFKC